MLTNLQYRVLTRIFPRHSDSSRGEAYERNSKLDVLLGSDFINKIVGKTVIDFGCGEGNDAIEMAQKGARRVIGIDIREDLLQRARNKAIEAGAQNSCIFTTSTGEHADIVVSIDAFEHFADPGRILNTMNTLLQPAGEVIVSFGPTWYHPLGGHTFSVFPWAHLIFSEEALIRWRSTFKTDGATRFCEVAGGLNQMTVRRFEKLVEQSPLKVAALEFVPIKRLKPFHNRLTREYMTATVRCQLIKR